MRGFAKTWVNVTLLCLSSCLLSCSNVNQEALPTGTQRQVSQAEQAGFVMTRYPTSTFNITAWQHLPPTPAHTIFVYFEGDGNSWKSKYRLSHNPTPRQPMALKLALRDPHSHVVYLARPCQYTPHTLDHKCEAKYWSSHRFAPEVILAMNEILNRLHQEHKNTNFVLIGFSGGASIAALVASDRQDVQGLITVAGDLDHDALTQHHRTTPLAGSLNPMKIAYKLQDLPQHHWSGGQDNIVPAKIAQQFAQQVDNDACVKTHILDNVSHQKGWEDHWHNIINTPWPCKPIS